MIKTYTFNDFGGNKLNYSPVEDLTYEKDCDHINNAFNAIAAFNKVMPKAIFSLTHSDNSLIVQSNLSFATYPIATTISTGLKKIEFNPNIIYNDEPNYFYPKYILSQSDSLTIHQLYTEVNVSLSTLTKITLYLRSYNSLGSLTDFTGADRSFIFLF